MGEWGLREVEGARPRSHAHNAEIRASDSQSVLSVIASFRSQRSRDSSLAPL